MSEAVQVAVEAALAAGKILRERKDSIGKISYKEFYDPVTEIDLLCEKTIIDRIKQTFPDHDILAEESGNAQGSSSSTNKWIIDPLDGTLNFSHGYPCYCVSIGLEHEGQLEVGVVYNPCLDELFVAERGKGSTLNNKPIKVSTIPTLKESLLVTGFHPKVINSLDDSFLTKECYPYKEAEDSENFYLLTPNYGGHVGFLSSFSNSGNYWLEHKIEQQLEKMKKMKCLLSCSEGYYGIGDYNPNQTYLKYNSEKYVNEFGYCSVVVSEGVKDAKGNFLADQGLRDAFGHEQLGGVAPVVANIVKDGLGLKYHWSVADYLQRSARHVASKTDVDQAYALGKAAVEFAVKGHNAVMPTIKRLSNKPYKWKIGMAQLSKVANVEKMMPSNFITKDGFGITEKCRAYLVPLIKGEDYPSYKNGLPKYVRLKNIGVKKKLSNFKI